VLAQWRCDCWIAMRLSRSAFVPPPKVASAVVHITPREAPLGVDPKRIEQVTEAAFGQRRKMLRSSLKSLPGALAAAENLAIDVERRAETLSVAEFVEIARLLS
jgi:16S rRNA (adenine1518-N6/adenine1519-N6)-dimethyltransferase